jgi:preprotein translocase subunit SecF
MYNIVGKRKVFLAISGVLIGLSILALILWGLKPGIDFTGGTLIELQFKNPVPTKQEILDKLKDLNLSDPNLQTSGDNGWLLRIKEINEATHQQILAKLGQPEETRFESIGPTIGAELTRKAEWAVVLVNLAILAYIAWAFRRLSKIITKGESWLYAGGAIFALVHDVILMLGTFAVLGHFRGFEINSTFITAVLTVIGYSVNDTIVVYDRIRENLLTYGWKDFTGIVNRSLNETLIRSLNTTFTTLLALLALFFFGGESIRDFILAMMVGIATGAWSSMALAMPFLFFKKRN